MMLLAETYEPKHRVTEAEMRALISAQLQRAVSDDAGRALRPVGS